MAVSLFRVFLGPIFVLFAIGVVILGIALVGVISDGVEDLSSNYTKPIPTGAPTVDASKSHADKHDKEAGKNQEFSIQDMRDCMDSGGVVETWKNDKTGHWMDICNLGNGGGDVWGLRCVNNCNEEITGWVADGEYRNVVEDYLVRNGYRAWP